MQSIFTPFCLVYLCAGSNDLYASFFLFFILFWLPLNCFRAILAVRRGSAQRVGCWATARKSLECHDEQRVRQQNLCAHVQIERVKAKGGGELPAVQFARTTRQHGRVIRAGVDLLAPLPLLVPRYIWTKSDQARLIEFISISSLSVCVCWLWPSLWLVFRLPRIARSTGINKPMRVAMYAQVARIAKQRIRPMKLSLPDILYDLLVFP
jgi:hypothetical protein